MDRQENIRKVKHLSKKIVILGGGVGGVVAANVLSKKVENATIILIDMNDTHHFQPSYPLVIINQRRPHQITKNLKLLTNKGVEFMQAEVLQIQPDNQLVDTNLGPLNYDYLIIALGAEQHPETVPGQSETAFNMYSFADVCRLRHQLLSFTEGNIVLYIAGIPYIGAIAPYETIFLLDSFFRGRGLRNKVNLTLITPETSPFPQAGPKIGASIRKMMYTRDIKFIAQAKILALNRRQKQLILDGGLHIRGDLFLAIPSHWGPSVTKDTALATTTGWLNVHPTRLVTKYPNIYGVGDATAIRYPLTREWAPKAGIFAHFQAEVVARNIALQIAGKQPSFRYKGKAFGISMLTGYKSARLISINYYRRPQPQMIMMRPSRIAYWAKIGFEKYWLNCWF